MGALYNYNILYIYKLYVFFHFITIFNHLNIYMLSWIFKIWNFAKIVKFNCDLIEIQLKF